MNENQANSFPSMASTRHLTVPQLRRRRYIVNPVQIKLSIFALLLFGSAVFAIWWEASGCFADLQKRVAIDYHQPELALRIANYSQQMSEGILLKAVFVMLILWLVVIIVSHHFFGPLYRLKVCLKTLKEGDLSCRMNLRKGDYLMDVADDFNQMAASLEQRLQEKK